MSSSPGPLPPVDLSLFKKEGLYLYLEDGRLVDFSKDRIKALGEEYWRNPEKLPESVRKEENFKTCTVCPYRGQDAFCSAMKPLLPFLEDMDEFKSFSKVVAVYVDAAGTISISQTTLQRALQYVSNLALFEYCEDAKEYHCFFKGIHPFMGTDDAAAVLFLNLYWLYGGDRKRIDVQLDQMRKAIMVTSKSCINRLRTMCHSDAFINSYIITHNFGDALGYIPDIMRAYHATAAHSETPDSPQTAAS